MSVIFSISSLVKISLTSFLCFSFVFRLLFFLFSKHSYICNKKEITRWLEHMKFILWKKDFRSKINFICSRHSLISSIKIICRALLFYLTGEVFFFLLYYLIGGLLFYLTRVFFFFFNSRTFILFGEQLQLFCSLSKHYVLQIVANNRPQSVCLR